MVTSEKVYQGISKEITENYFARIPAPVTRSELEETAEDFINGFLNLPLEEKETFYCHVNNGGRGTDMGYVRRTREKDNEDDKQYFHYHPRIRQVLAPQLKLHIPEVDDFLERADHIYQATSRSIGEIMKALDTRNPGIYDKFFSDDQESNFVLRILGYDKKTEGQFLAAGHYDRGAYTVALGENAPGLRMGKNKDYVKFVDHQEDSALFFKARQVVSGIDDGFYPAWHDVIQKEDETYSDEIARWAIVCFIEPLKISMVTWEETHTPLV